MIVSEQPYETSDPTVNSQVINLKASGADVFFNVTTPKFAAQAIRKAAEIGWKPLHLLNNVSNSVGSVLKPAGMENAKDIVSDRLLQGPDRSDLERRCRASRHWAEFMDKYFPKVTSHRASRFTATAWLRRWCKSSSSAATTSRAKTS